MMLKEGRQGTALRRWEAALLAGVAVAALSGTVVREEQNHLADKIVRLHVIANSDGDADQALKLKVRDKVLEVSEDLIPAGSSQEEAMDILSAHLEELATAGAGVVGAEGYTYPVTASLEEDVWFPTKTYTDFALPAGNYTALRLTIGEGAGQNWWCVVFPPLCMGSVTEAVAESAPEDCFTDTEVSLITGEDEGYVVKFKTMELLSELEHWASGWV